MTTTQRPATYTPDESLSAARRMLAIGDAARAIELLEGRADREPSGEALALLGDAYFLGARYDLAEAAWKSALERAPADPELLAKAERAATNVLTGMAGDEPQMVLFRERFTREWLLGGPHPGATPATHPIEPRHGFSIDSASFLVLPWAEP